MTDFTGFRIGQKWRVVDAAEIGYSSMVNGDIFIVDRLQYDSRCAVDVNNRALFSDDVSDGNVELISEPPTEISEDVSATPYTSPQDEPENVSQEGTGSLTDSPTTIPAELLWNFITGAGEYNGHFQMSVDKMSFETLKEVVQVLEKWLGQSDEYGDSLKIEMMYNGDHFKTWGASVCQTDYWQADEVEDGRRDRLLFSVEHLEF